jgi:hypothetical protein
MTLQRVLLALALTGSLVVGLAGSAVAQATPDFHPFAQTWRRHGFGLAVDRNGYGSAVFRVYKWCSDDPRPPCDRLSGDEIVNGGHTDLVFSRVAGSTAFGAVIASNLSPVLAVRDVSLTLQPYDTAVLRQGSKTLQLCGPRFEQEAPASVRQTNPCGA